MVNDQENIRQIRERNRVGVQESKDSEWEEIRRKMAEGSSEEPKHSIPRKKGRSMKKMEQVLHELKEELSDQEEALANYQAQDMESDAEWITEGWTEALTFAIRKIEEAMKQSQEESVRNMRNFLSPEETNATEKPN